LYVEKSNCGIQNKVYRFI